MPEKKKYEVTQPINVDNKAYAVGKTVDLEEEVAQGLLAAGAVKPVEAKGKSEK